MSQFSLSFTGITANQEHSIQDELQKKLPDHFLPEKKSSDLFASLRSKKLKSPSISLKESLTVKEKALFIKTYHDLVIEKYNEIKSTKKEEPSEKAKKEKAEKDKKFLKELTKLDKEVIKLLDKDPKKLNEELYELSPVRYPQSPILGRNALASRKKSISIDDKPSLKAMSGEELFKFYLLFDLVRQQIKIDELEKSKTIQEKQLGEYATKISLEQAKTDLKQAEEDLEKAEEDLKKAKEDLEKARKKLKQPKTNLEQAQKKVAKKHALHMELSALEKIKGNLEKEKITKANIISSINNLYKQKDSQFSAEDLKIFSDSYITSKYPLKQNPLLLIKKICYGSEAKTPQNESPNATIDSNENPKLNANFIALIEQELLKEELLKKLLGNFMKFSEANGDSKAKFEKNYREDLAKFIKACPSEKERLDVITSFALKLGISEKNLEVGFYNICANDANAELRDFKSSNITGDRYKKLQAKFVDYLFKIEEIDPNFKMGSEELSAIIESSEPPTPKVKQKKRHPTTSTSLFFGLISAEDLKSIAKNINLFATNLETFNVNFKEELEKGPNSNVFKAFLLALGNNKETQSKQP